MSSEPQIINEQRFVTSSDNRKLAFLCVLSRLNDSFLHLVCIRMCAERNLFVSGSTEEAQYAKSDRIAADVFTPDIKTTSLPSFSFFKSFQISFPFGFYFLIHVLWLHMRTVVTRQSVTCGFELYTPGFFFMWSKLKRKVKWKTLPQICVVWGVISVWCSMHAASYTLSLRQ